jgi:O-antigen/teichoic acid export membrane protein
MNLIEKTKKTTYKWLKRSEKYFKTDMIYLAKGGFWLSFGQVLVSLIGLGVAIAFANLLPKETYGTYKFAISIINLLVIAGLPGLNGALTQAISRGYEGYYKRAVIQKIKFGLLGSIAALAISAYYYFNDNNTLSLIFLISALFVPLLNSFNVWLSLLVGRKKFQAVSYRQIFVKVFTSLIIIGTIILTQNIFIIILVFFISNILAHLILHIKILIQNPPNKEDDGGVLKYGKELTGINIIQQIANNIDNVLIFHFLGSTEVAIYSIAMGPIKQMKNPLNSFTNLLIPKLAKKNIIDLKQTLFAKVLKTYILIIPIIIFYILIAPWFYNTFFPLYESSIVFSQILSISLLFLPSIIIESLLNSHKKTKEIYKTKIIYSSSKIIFLLTLTPILGIWGVVYALLGAEAILYVTYISVFKSIKV